MFRKGKIRLALTLGLVAGSTSLGLIAPTMSGAAAPTGTITIAEGANATPNYIFPFYPPAQCTVTNTSNFQILMFRPLYFFGLGASAGLQPKISLGNTPKYTNGNKTVTFTTKGWKFADGQTVNAESVMFFLNMYKAVPTGFCTYTSGLGIPDQVASASGKGNTVTMHLKSAVSPLWFNDNELATITPMANSWDRSSASQTSKCASGKYGAASTTVACKNVQAYLDKTAQNVSTFTGKMWQSGVDGPWRLTKMDNLGNATFQPNSHYSGPQKAQVQYVKEVAFTTAQAEENQLQAGNIDMGYVDPSILTSPAPKAGVAGANWGQLGQRYNLVTNTTFANNYMNLNFGKNPNSAAMSQLYFRQALETSIDQASIDKNAFKNYAVPTWSALPPTTPSSETGPVKQPYPYSLSAAETLLTSNGWSKSGGTQLVCTSPGSGAGKCGAGITSGQQLKLNIEWVSGSPSEDTMMNAIIADWASLGISVSHTTGTFGQTVGKCPVAYNPSSSFDICNWGGGWLFAPDYYPSGEPLWLTAAGSNSGLYSSPTMDSLIKATLSTNIKLTAYANFTATDLPVLWDPLSVGIGEFIKTLKSSIGFSDTLLTTTPEYFHY
jgi:peptide/nickel transport system substrate-binding protein